MDSENAAPGAARRGVTPGVLLAGWTLLAAFLSAGMPPVVDLPVQAAQLETLAGLVRGDPLVTQVFEVQWTTGYGLVHWLFLPVALLTNGAVAARVAWFVCLELYAVGVLLLLRQLRRPDWTLLLALPFAFGVSYWYGFLSELFARDLALLTLASFCACLEHDSRRRRALFVAGMFATWLTHLFIFGVLLAVVAAVVAARHFRANSVRLALLGAAGPLVLLVPALVAVGGRSGKLLPLYGVYAHTPAWFFRYFRAEGRLSVALPLLLAVVLVSFAFRRWRLEPKEPMAALLTVVLLFVLCPKSFYPAGGFTLANVRLPALIGLAAVMVTDVGCLPRPLWASLCALSLASLGETAVFHQRMREAVAGLTEVEHKGPPDRHATLVLATQAVPGARLPYLEHLGEWVTACLEGVGNHAMADSPHLPVHYRPGEELPASLLAFTPEQLARLDEVYVFGRGALPPQLSGFCQRAEKKAWRRLTPCAAPADSERR
jgi:hypothetical protein